MTTIARQLFKLNNHDNTTLDHSNLCKVAVQKNQDYINEQTAYIFKDGSAIIDCGNHDYKIVTNYGLSKDHEQLN